MRVYDEEVEVRCGIGGSRRPDERWGPGAPEAFVWRGRRFVVRAVLDRWVERRPWWRAALDPSRRSVMTVDDVEEDLWRVEASPGRMRRTGVFDLARAGGVPADEGPILSEAGGVAGGACWRLRRVSD